MQSEFRMITDLNVVAPKELAFNYDELKGWLSQAMKDYKTMVVTQDSLPDAKSTLAKINRVEKSINDYRIAVKKRLMEAYDNDFKPKCDELGRICQEASGNLKSQINAFDERRREEKMNDLRDFFNANATDDATEYISFDAICNPRWGNATYSEEDAHKEILREIAACVSSVNAIRTLKSPMEPALLDYYRQTRDLAGAMAKHDQLMRLREQEEKRKAEIERLRQEQEQRERAKAEAQAAQQEEMEEPVENGADPTPAAADVAEEPTYTLDFRVVVTAAQGAALKAFLKSNGIQFMPVPKE